MFSTAAYYCLQCILLCSKSDGTMCREFCMNSTSFAAIVLLPIYLSFLNKGTEIAAPNTNEVLQTGTLNKEINEK